MPAGKAESDGSDSEHAAPSLEAIQEFMELSSVCNVCVMRRCYGLGLEET